LSRKDELELTCGQLKPALDFLSELGLRLESIYPADDPHTAVLTSGARTVRLTSQPGSPPPGAEPAAFTPGFVLTRAGSGSGEGRAGMFYRDLIPGRLGGRFIASHITIADGGPVADWVHYHRVAWQVIYVRSGWVRVVYEDQGEPFVANAGDVLLQPPEIRHRVLESSPGLEVVEISSPALHETLAEHEMQLPNGKGDPARCWSGQRFLRHVHSSAQWTPFLGGEAQETEIHSATGGIAQLRTVRPGTQPVLAFPPHDGELVLGFVLEGTARLDYRDGPNIGPGDCFVVPPDEAWSLSQMSKDFRLLHVTSAAIE